MDEHIRSTGGPKKPFDIRYDEVVHFRAWCEDESICTILNDSWPMGNTNAGLLSWYTIVPRKPGRTTMVITMTGEHHGLLEIDRGELTVDGAPKRDVLAVARPLPRTESILLETAPPLYHSTGGAPPARCVELTRASTSIRARFAGIDEPGVHLFICMAAREVVPGRFLWLDGWRNQNGDSLDREFCACARSEGEVVTALTLLVDPEGDHFYKIAETRGSSVAVCTPKEPAHVAQ